MSTTLRTITRRPVEGDLVVNKGKVWEVEEIRKVYSGRIQFISVVDFETGHLPNTFQPREVLVLSAATAASLRAQKEA